MLKYKVYLDKVKIESTNISMGKEFLANAKHITPAQKVFIETIKIIVTEKG